MATGAPAASRGRSLRLIDCHFEFGDFGFRVFAGLLRMTLTMQRYFVMFHRNGGQHDAIDCKERG